MLQLSAWCTCSYAAAIIHMLPCLQHVSANDYTYSTLHGTCLTASLLQETATTMIGMLLGMAFTHAFNGELQLHQHAKSIVSTCPHEHKNQVCSLCDQACSLRLAVCLSGRLIYCSVLSVICIHHTCISCTHSEFS